MFSFIGMVTVAYFTIKAWNFFGGITFVKFLMDMSKQAAEKAAKEEK